MGLKPSASIENAAILINPADEEWKRLNNHGKFTVLLGRLMNERVVKFRAPSFVRFWKK